MEKFLIVADSPYTYTRNAKICKCIFKTIQKLGFMPICASFNHDTNWFPEDENGICWYEEKNNKIGPIYSLLDNGQNKAINLHSIVESLNPDCIISIGDIIETDFIYAIKKMFPKTKWINIVTDGSVPIHPKRKEVFDSIDLCIALNNIVKENIDYYFNKNCELINFGPSDEFNKNIKENKESKFICINHNTSQSNIPVILKTFGELKKNNITAYLYLHTNINDLGYYDIDYLIDKYNIGDIVELPKMFNSINDALPIDDYIEKIQENSFIIDTSFQASTGLTTLECMRLGLVPIVNDVGFYKNKEKNIFKKCDSVEFISYDEKEIKISDYKSLYEIIKDFCTSYENEYFNIDQKRCIQFSYMFSEKLFQDKFIKKIKDFFSNSKKINVEII